MWVFLPTRFNSTFRQPESISLWWVEDPPYNISVIASRVKHGVAISLLWKTNLSKKTALQKTFSGCLKVILSLLQLPTL